MNSFSHDVFRLTFQGASVFEITQDRKLSNGVAVISINNATSIASYRFYCSSRHVGTINFASSKPTSVNDVVEAV